MRKVSLSLLFAVIAILGVFAQEKNVPKVVLIGIGAKNPTFSESTMPSFAFYYTPELKNQGRVGSTAKAAISLLGGSGAKAIYLGEPKILEEMWDKKELRYHSLLYDKNGVACWEGTIDPDKGVVDADGFDGMSLKEALKTYVEKQGVVEKEAAGEIQILTANSMKRGKYYNYPLAERKVPDFKVVDVMGSTVSVKSLIEIGSPVLVIFFEFPADIDGKAAQESKKASLGQMMQSAAGSSVGDKLLRMHKQLFGKQ